MTTPSGGESAPSTRTTWKTFSAALLLPVLLVLLVLLVALLLLRLCRPLAFLPERKSNKGRVGVEVEVEVAGKGRELGKGEAVRERSDCLPCL